MSSSIYPEEMLEKTSYERNESSHKFTLKLVVILTFFTKFVFYSCLKTLWGAQIKKYSWVLLSLSVLCHLVIKPKKRWSDPISPEQPIVSTSGFFAKKGHIFSPNFAFNPHFTLLEQVYDPKQPNLTPLNPLHNRNTEKLADCAPAAEGGWRAIPFFY